MPCGEIESCPRDWNFYVFGCGTRSPCLFQVPPTSDSLQCHWSTGLFHLLCRRTTLFPRVWVPPTCGYSGTFSATRTTLNSEIWTRGESNTRPLHLHLRLLQAYPVANRQQGRRLSRLHQPGIPVCFLCPFCSHRGAGAPGPLPCRRLGCGQLAIHVTVGSEDGVGFRDGRGELKVAIWNFGRLFKVPTDQHLLAYGGSRIRSKPERALILGAYTLWRKVCRSFPAVKQRNNFNERVVIKSRVVHYHIPTSGSVTESNRSRLSRWCDPSLRRLECSAGLSRLSRIRLMSHGGLTIFQPHGRFFAPAAAAGFLAGGASSSVSSSDSSSVSSVSSVSVSASSVSSSSSSPAGASTVEMLT